jgi:flagella basal body P-ring formation protein FlgA
MKALVVLALLSATATAEPIESIARPGEPGRATKRSAVESIVRERIAPSLPVGLGVAKVYLPASLEQLDIDPAKLAVQVPRELRTGRVSIRVAVRGRSAVYVQVAIGKLVEVAVARRGLTAGTVIGAADVSIEHVALAPASGPAPAATLVGATVTNDIAAGMPIEARDVTLPRPLARGTQVSVEINRGAVRVRGTATLEAAARAGQPASARLAHTRTIVRGTLHAPATLVVGESP